MSEREPTRPYIFQPEPDRPAYAGRIYAIGGPGSEKYAGKRFTRAEAQESLEKLALELVGMSDAFRPTRRGFVRGSTEDAKRVMQAGDLRIERLP